MVFLKIFHISRGLKLEIKSINKKKDWSGYIKVHAPFEKQCPWHCTLTDVCPEPLRGSPDGVCLVPERLLEHKLFWSFPWVDPKGIKSNVISSPSSNSLDRDPHGCAEDLARIRTLREGHGQLACFRQQSCRVGKFSFLLGTLVSGLGHTITLYSGGS